MRALPLLLLFSVPFLPSASAQDAMLHAVDQEGEYLFLPDNLTVPQGGIVSVMLFGAEPHAVRSVDGAWPDVDLPANAQANFTAPRVVGDYVFYCFYHGSADGGMRGVLTVTERAQTDTQPGGGADQPKSGGADGDAENETSVGALVGALALAGAALLARRR